MASFGQAMPPLARPGQKQAAPSAAAGHPLHQPPPHHHHPYGHGSAVLPAAAPQGTFAAGTKIQVGHHRVVIQRYLSEGGFAHVYVVKLPAPVDGTDLAVLKRVAVPDKDSLRSMRTEVETMKRLKGHRAIVTYIDSHASELRGGGYEVFLLMEYCDGGGLMDFMNTRLQHRLTEPEILAIFSDVAEGVACMHYLKPPLLHRDLKVENVLIAQAKGAGAGSGATRRRFKLCDFGSAAAPLPAPTSVAACRQLDEDIQMHTTLQYRSPEMVDVYRRQPIDEKSDIWALGVLLYKLCYYTTPFEEQASQLAILNASYRFPSHPVFSERLKSLIASMLRENQQARPNIYQVLREACAMQGKDVPIQNIYASSSQPSLQPGSRPHAADKLSTTPTPVVGAVFAPPTKTQQVIPDIVPMRRGRPTASSSSSRREPPAPSPRPHAKPAPVASGDPFAALDGNPSTTSAALAADELSARFPTLDQFTLLHDHGTRFSFDSGGAGATAASPPSAGVPDAPKAAAKDLNQRVAERLADDAFAASATAAAATAPAATTSAAPVSAAAPGKPTTAPAMGIHKSASEPPHPTNRPMPFSATTAGSIRSPSPRKPAEMSRASAIISSTPELQAISAQRQQQQRQPSPVRPTPVVMVSTGTMTSPPPTPPLPSQPSASAAAARTGSGSSGSTQHALRASSLPRGRYVDEHMGGGGSGGSGLETQLPVRPPSQAQRVRHVSSSARPSLEGARPALDALLHRVPSRDTASASASSLASRPPQRPVSAYLDSSLDYLRERESSGGSSNNAMLSLPDGGAAAAAAAALADSPRLGPRGSASSSGWGGPEETTIESNVEYLRSMEESADSRRDRSHHHHHRPFSKRASLTLHVGAGGSSSAAGGVGSGSGSGGKKSILSGKFGDAFKRFETSTSSSSGGGANGSGAGVPPPRSPALGGARTPSPLKQLDRQEVSNRGYRASMDYDGDHRYGTGGTAGFVGPGVDDNVLDDVDERTPEARREIERRRLSLEEKRVAAAAAEYRQRLAQRSTGGGGGGAAAASAPPALPKSIGGVSRAVSIQNRVQNLLNESKAAAGGSVAGGSGGSRPSTAPSLADRQRPALSGSGGGGAPRPAAKPKPMHLSNKAGAAATAAAAMPRGSEGGRPGSPTMGPPAAATRPQLVAMDLPGQPVLEGMSMQDKDDYIRDFTRRFPSLTTIEKEEVPGREW